MGLGGRPPGGQAGVVAVGALRQPDDELVLPGRQVRQHQLQRRQGRPLPARHRAGAAGEGRGRGLPRPGGQLRAGEQVQGHRRRADLPQRPVVDGTWTKAKSDSETHPVHCRRRAQGAGGQGVDRVWCRSTATADR
ncbi:hypothetical protein [Nocardioides convexus]|uniref:hypothetical protein n=1 Tax=Nocardioides convexus TaxID=2712224 RepID=UPI00241819A5|nr:hypothetical protein [Nocardioides convexus]